jgi:[acyl-carrier-protein] S-malonyltransferase
LGVHLSRIMWEGPDRALTLTHNAQPAILAHSLAIHAVVGDMLSPKIGAGHSLGEYSAYVIAGAIKLSDAARLVRRRGELMLDAGGEREGTMSAIVGLETGEVERCCAEATAEGDGVAVAANINSPDQTVISGDPVAVERAGVLCKAANAKRVIPLKVSGAFHSPLMAPARKGLQAELAKVKLKDPEFPIIANATAKLVKDAKTAEKLLGDQLTSPVRWVDSMMKATDDTDDGTVFLEVGPGTVLAGLMRKIVKGRRAVSLGGAEEVGAFLEQKK